MKGDGSKEEKKQGIKKITDFYCWIISWYMLLNRLYSRVSLGLLATAGFKGHARSSLFMRNINFPVEDWLGEKTLKKKTTTM